MGTSWTITPEMRNNLKNGIAYVKPKRKIWCEGLNRSNPGIYAEAFEKLSKSTKECQKLGKIHNIATYIKSTGFTLSHRHLMSVKASNRPRIRCKCGKSLTKAMWVRWHKEKCYDS